MSIRRDTKQLPWMLFWLHMGERFRSVMNCVDFKCECGYYEKPFSLTRGVPSVSPSPQINLPGQTPGTYTLDHTVTILYTFRLWDRISEFIAST